MNANGGEIRMRAEMQGTRGKRLPAPAYATKPAPIRAIPREELMRRALAAEAGWDKRKDRDAAKFRTANGS